MNLRRPARRWRAIALVAMLVCAGAAWAQDAEDGEPVGEPLSGKALSDRDFGVLTRQFGLDRRVEMYQWRREFGIASQGDGYERVWNAAPIDSSGYSPGHANPSRMPLENRRWWSESATLDGKPLGSEVLRAIGEWRVFRPNFSRLPSNLAATFQPEGDGLGSSENPLDPQIGDLRVSWRELRLPPLEGKLELREGVWRLRPEAAAAALNAAPAREPVATAAAEPESGGWSPGWFAVAVVLALIVLYRLRKRRQARR
ncbi:MULTISPECIES: TMEM43 family protein [Lysobacter]|jgi:hypothetical protein|uniref:TMEM43 family protein n=2 Tax=Lysobacter gummosus TaxID=262324 RepID=A0ABY3XA29_9GAMM|nr:MULTISPECIES: TMEM43 family protein [Lysobacter]ALN92415.1 hypothetical protein LG3211_3469 [Lysobacter gummosus]UJB20686.1 TMEM43 family protein [Lysobacter capsici]UJQ30200.1 TMEM43 family protein [Lysobacter gummosus]UNP27997.1 TMEM43 family protein [Lysobacter gummosus]